MNARNVWANVLVVAGGTGMVIGAIDPMEGSLLILPGSGMLALGTYLGKAERRGVAFKVSAFVLILMGVSVLWFLPAIRSIGGLSGRELWPDLLAFVPYLVGWNMAIWGPGSPRWLLWLGILLGLQYQVTAGVLLKAGGVVGGWRSAIIIAAIGIVALVGCIYRLVTAKKARAANAMA